MLHYGVKNVNAVATEVFRKSPNGNEVIKRYEDILGESISIIN
jgi:exopolyphosphatase/pppGpp-phosphohydrolase